jgi:hypothetical protein
MTSFKKKRNNGNMKSEYKHTEDYLAQYIVKLVQHVAILEIQCNFLIHLMNVHHYIDEKHHHEH